MDTYTWTWRLIPCQLVRQREKVTAFPQTSKWKEKMQHLHSLTELKESEEKRAGGGKGIVEIRGEKD